MIFYVALVAILNLALGYGLCKLLGAKRQELALPSGELSEFTEPADY
jgi:hypothetical protein